MSDDRHDPYVELGMYPFASVAWAWDELWSAVARRVAWLPDELTRTRDEHAAWADEACLVTQVCGAPLVAHHLDDLSVVGAFDLDLPEGVSPGRYHSVLISRHDRSLDRLVDDQVCVAINSDDSLTGRLSLLDATVGVDRAWPGDVTLRGSHLQSMRALASGDADLASIDPWSLAFITAEEPDLLAGLHRVGNGPTVPSPPIAARATLDRAQLAEIRDGFIAALDDPVTAVARQALHIRGFVALTVDDYLPLRDLLPG